MPASVELALAEQESGRNRPVLCVIGGSSCQYSLQSVYTEVQREAHLTHVVLQKEEYGILKELAELEETPNVAGLELPGIDIASLAKGYGANAVSTRTAGEPGTVYRVSLKVK